MTIDGHIDPARQLVHLRYAGTPHFTVWANTMREVFAHPSYAAGFGFVADITDSAPPDTQYILACINFVTEHAAEFASARWANVTTDPAHYGMTRVTQGRSQELPSTVEVFATFEAAIAWASPRSAGEL